MIDSEPDGTRDLWHEFADLDSASPKVWMDACLAAFAVCGKLTLVTLDGDFAAHRDQGLDLRLLLRA
jgi:predicted nucleic acid-binding protein